MKASFLGASYADLPFQDALQNYTENTTWGTDGQTFFSAGPHEPLVPQPGDPSPSSGDSYAFDTPESSSKT